MKEKVRPAETDSLASRPGKVHRGPTPRILTGPRSQRDRPPWWEGLRALGGGWRLRVRRFRTKRVGDRGVHINIATDEGDPAGPPSFRVPE